MVYCYCFWDNLREQKCKTFRISGAPWPYHMFTLVTTTSKHTTTPEAITTPKATTVHLPSTTSEGTTEKSRVVSYMTTYK